MSNNSDSNSDTSDEEYIPNEETADLSCEDSVDDGEENEESSKSSAKKRKIKSESQIIKRKRKGGIKLDGESDHEVSDENEDLKSDDDENSSKANVLAEEKEKERTDSLWADFMKDVGGLPKKKTEVVKKDSKNSTQISKNVESTCSTKKEPSQKTVSVTKIFDFAGEEVRITKQVSPDSNKAKKIEKPETTSSSKPALKSGGISMLLDKINKKPKLNVLDKTKIDWQSFKDDEGIEDELSQYKKGKDGYLEKQDFLQRTDLRQFEIEKKMRQSKR